MVIRFVRSASDPYLFKPLILVIQMAWCGCGHHCWVCGRARWFLSHPSRVRQGSRRSRHNRAGAYGICWGQTNSCYTLGHQGSRWPMGGAVWDPRWVYVMSYPSGTPRGSWHAYQTHCMALAQNSLCKAVKTSNPTLCDVHVAVPNRLHDGESDVCLYFLGYCGDPCIYVIAPLGTWKMYTKYVGRNGTARTCEYNDPY